MNETEAYVMAAQAAIAAWDPSVRPYLTETCSECDETAYSGDGLHTVVNGFVVIGCEGYWIINPNVIGLDRPAWTNMRGDQ